MTYERKVPGDLDYDYCLYGSSRTRFRGPKRTLTKEYLAFLGGAETFGRFVPVPYPALIEGDAGVACINLAVANAGLDLYLQDPSVLRVIEAAAVVVLQVVGAQNMSNRFYRVHPRRNDRFLRASESLKHLYHDVDFTEFHFTTHMLETLERVCPQRFRLVRLELQQAWVARMRHLVSMLPGRTVLFWFAPHPPLYAPERIQDDGPMFVSARMVEEIATHCDGFTQLCIQPGQGTRLTEGMIYAPEQEPLALRSFGPGAHRAAARVLAPELEKMLKSKRPAE